jgi:hypothetical protein
MPEQIDKHFIIEAAKSAVKPRVRSASLRWAISGWNEGQDNCPGCQSFVIFVTASNDVYIARLVPYWQLLLTADERRQSRTQAIRNLYCHQPSC